MIDADTMQTRFPDTFGSFNPDLLTAAIEDAEAEIDRPTFGALADKAVLNLAAHIALTDRRGVAEGISSTTAGLVGVVFDRAFRAKEFLEEYRRICRKVTFGVTISG